MEQVSFPEEQEASGPLVCQWRDCNKAFTGHPSLAIHLSDDHVGWKKGDYFCEWTNCARRGAKCHNRFALMMHLRIHTGEKPFECTYSDCGQAFGRMDALTRHKRTEHGEDCIPQPALTMKRSSNKKPSSEPKPKKARISEKYPVASLCSDDNSNEEDENLVTVENTSNKLLLNVTSDYSQYRIAKAQLNYLLRENEMLQEEYDYAQKKIKRLKTEREVLLESAMLHDNDE